MGHGSAGGLQGNVGNESWVVGACLPGVRGGVALGLRLGRRLLPLPGWGLRGAPIAGSVALAFRPRLGSGVAT